MSCDMSINRSIELCVRLCDVALKLPNIEVNIWKVMMNTKVVFIAQQVAA